MSKHPVPLSNLAVSLKSSVAVLETFLAELYGPPAPKSVRRRVVQVVTKNFRNWLDHPELITILQLAGAVGLEPVDYFELTKTYFRWPVNSVNSKIRSSEAEGFHQWLLENGVIERLPIEWPPCLDLSEMRTLSIVDDVLDIRATTFDATGSTATPEIDPRGSVDDEQRRIESALRKLIEELRHEPIRKVHFFLLRLLERLNADSALMEIVRTDGLPIVLLESTLVSFGKKVPSAKSPATFQNDVRWAVVRLRRNHATELWISENVKSGALLTSKPLNAKSNKRPERRVAKGDIEIGQIRWIMMEESRLGKKSSLSHPAVVVGSASHNKWLVVSLTSTVDGSPAHRRVPRPTEQGLASAGFVWHEVQKVYLNQIGQLIGWCHPDLIDVIARTVTVRTSMLDELRRVASAKHSMS